MLGLVKDWLLDPAALLFLTSMVAIVQYYRLAKGKFIGRIWPISLIVGWLALYAVFTAPVVVNPLVRTVEHSVDPNTLCAPDSDLILLGGGVDSRATSAEDFHYMRPATFVRASAAASLAHQNSAVRVIIAGGPLRDIAEATVIAEYLTSLGVDRDRLILETRSRSTRENALNVAQLLEENRTTKHVRLVTSALHMPRALGSFKRVLQDSSINLCPVSVDFHGLNQVPMYAWMPQTTSIVKFDLLFHELIALTLYQLRSWI